MSTPLFKSTRHDRPHARLYDHHLNHAAWRGLSGPAFKLNAYLLAKWRAQNPNSFPVGTRRVAEMIGVSQASAKNAVDELIEKGFLREERRGQNNGRVATRERIVSLTRHDTETTPGHNDFPTRLWRERSSNASDSGA